jgi:hypothetical protein
MKTHSTVGDLRLCEIHFLTTRPKRRTTTDFVIVMDVTDINPQLAELSANVDGLEAALKPLIDDIGSVSSKLPLLDKAKLNVLTCYAIESLLFCECLATAY